MPGRYFATAAVRCPFTTTSTFHTVSKRRSAWWQLRKKLDFPMLGGSSLPVTWRLPDIEMPLGAHIEDALMVGVGGSDPMDFHALEGLQCMMERRAGGETGVKAVQLIEGDDVWKAGDDGRWSKELLTAALSRSDTPQGLTVKDGRTQDLVGSGVLPGLVPHPGAYFIEYRDGSACNAADAGQGGTGFQFCRQGSWLGSSFDAIFADACTERHLLRMSRLKNRADVHDAAGALPHRKDAADQRHSGKLPDLQSAEPSAPRNASSCGFVSAAFRIAILPNLIRSQTGSGPDTLERCVSKIADGLNCQAWRTAFS